MLRRWWRDTVDSTEWVETRRALRQARGGSLAQLPEGVFARVAGKVAAAPDAARLTAPFSTRPCVAYWLSAEGVGGPLVERLAVPFVLETAGGAVHVDPRDARFSLSRTREARTRGFPQPTLKQRELMDALVGHGVIPDAITYTEAILAVGDEVVVGGFLVREVRGPHAAPDPQLGASAYRETRTGFSLIGHDRHPLLIANDRGLVE